MTVPAGDDLLTGVDLSSAFETLDALQSRARVKAAMQAAAKLLEYAAYEMALVQPAGDVSEFIHIAARLDLASRRMEPDRAQTKVSEDLQRT
ncbi:hypothetical protein ROLI_022870 [Roseobacter fucihabitans]|uniref:Uncharacterized protein n=1 Tax=Roseobacter fucihabitans TaxID=1537242 RepID=A0ABZ2BT42_9RHOB|nr:hypothetical protein [Roseobacter litoralis]MBC6967477.1 hypothetical protein [Roseobacter litoralis]